MLLITFERITTHCTANYKQGQSSSGMFTLSRHSLYDTNEALHSLLSLQCGFGYNPVIAPNFWPPEDQIVVHL